MLEKLILGAVICECYSAGRIPLIKLVRTLTDWGLKEAKDYVENTAASMSITLDYSGNFGLTQRIKELEDENRRLSLELFDVKNQLRNIIEG